MKRRTSYRCSTLFGVVTIAVGILGVFAYTGATTITGVAVSTLVITVALVPLYDPQPRRTLDLIRITIKRVGVACLALLGVGALGVVALPGVGSLAVLGVALVVMIPPVIVSLRGEMGPQRYLVVGDDPAAIWSTIDQLPREPIGFLSPVLPTHVSHISDAGLEPAPTAADDDDRVREEIPATDGGVALARRDTLAGIDRLSGLSRLEHVLNERSIDTVALAFTEADRQECFGVLRVCHDNGVDVLARADLDHALLGTGETEELVNVNIEPWSWYSRLAKRAFDIAFATIGLLVLAPLITVIAVAIKLDSPGPVLYGQRRTTELGATFPVWKFRSMLPESEDARPGDDEDRITRVGRVLRETHMDEIPQLISILVGDMSVVGPRAAWTDEESVLMEEVEGWSQRWMIPPGLTGLAQIRGIDSTDGEGKLECDLEYIDRQSLALDIWIVTLQLWSVARDCIALATDSKNS